MPAELDQMNPEMGQAMPDTGEARPDLELSPEEQEQQGKMAKADLYKLASYSHKLFKQLHDDDELEAWVQAKITKAADYIASVYHFLEYEMKFNEYGHHLDNSDTLSEGQKMRLKELLAEAKEKTTELKKNQAKKSQAKKVEENRLQKHEEPCAECMGTGYVTKEGMSVHPEHAPKIAKYAKLRNAVKAISGDKNGDGVVDEKDKKVDEEMSSTGGTITRSKGVTRHTHNPDRFSDEPHTEPKSQAKSRSAAEKAGDKAADKAAEKDSKDYEKKHPGTVTRVKDGQKVEEAKKKGDGNLANNAKPYDKVTRGDVIAGRLGKDEKGGDDVKEAAPSADLTKKEKSAVVKKAKKGGDIGKPGKSFDKVAKAAGGGEKGKKIAAAAMWKNIKETTAYVIEKAEVEKKAKRDYDEDGKIETGKEEHAGSVDKAIKASKAKETVKESTDMTRLRELTGRLNQNEKTSLNESSEASSIRALTKRLLG